DILDINPAVLSMMGYEKEEMCGQHYLAFFTEEEHPKAIRYFEEIKNGDAKSMEVTVRHKNGHSIDLSVSGAPLVIEGRLEGVLGVVKDVTARKRSEQTLRETNQKLQALIGAAPVAIYTVDLEQNITMWSKGAEQLFGWTAEEVTGQPLPTLPDGCNESLFDQLLQDGQLAGVEATRKHKNGKLLYVNVWGAALRDETGEMTGVMSIVSDSSERKLAEVAMRESEKRYRSVVELCPEAIIVHQNAVVRYVNPAAAKLGQVNDPEEMIGDSIFSFIHPEYRQQSVARYTKKLEERRKSGNTLETDLTVVLKDGTPFIGEVNSKLIEIDGEPATLTMIKDVTARQETENQLKRMAYYDALTGLPNRVLFKETLSQGLAEMEKGSFDLAILFLDMDRFKYINDTFGHPFGDLMLKVIGGRLQECIGDRGMLARMGGDEFTILLENVNGAERMTQMAEDILAQFRDPIVIDDHELLLTPSIGIAVAPFDGEDADSLMKHADAAMYRAKEHGGNRYEFYTSAISVDHYARILLENDLRRALERTEFVLHYQPKIDAITRRIVSMEALVRWQRPGYGMVSPGLFIPLAEETGLILALGEWVLREACRQNKEWQDMGFAPLRVAVNVSAKQFHQSNVVDMIHRVLEETGLDPEWLEIEITESTIMKNAEGVIATVQQLKRMGVHIAIDDFGTGYSSLGYLRRFHLNTLKVDRSFLQDVLEDSENTIIVSAIINLAHNLKLNVVAEGVETEEQLAFLIELGCDEVQGYLFSPPISAERFLGLLEQQCDELIS
ncbi:MAG: sensor domain-containing protein, partial [Tumebacillaceae bacterium]